MRYWYFHLSMIVLLAVMIMGCGEKLTEEQMYAKASEFENDKNIEEAIGYYEKIVDTFPESDASAETLYKLGVYYANHVKDFEKSVNAYKRLIEQYPNSSFVVQSSFMIGYRYANDIKDMEKAKTAYQDFLKKYPEHELASSVQWELDHLGEDISSIEIQLGNNKTEK